ncbi:hypothetical protein JMA_04110 [Jeotgalibacillus malaysiensis]|uniref:Uncharacterized protein n=1 Tax=Jeotgalibacillus malaysiensis TaxID=1508404 RepID=A0A0B5AME5_9BACL|nr:hypothetical protein JMA_04110 [Jeotgalibacillus malaysiensis]
MDLLSKSHIIKWLFLYVNSKNLLFINKIYANISLMKDDLLYEVRGV